MRRIILTVFLLLPLLAQAQYSKFVDPKIGSEGLGRTFIGPSMPFGMCKPGPDCVSMPNAGWAPMPEAVKGFSQTHVSGTGGGQKYGNILIQPFVGECGRSEYLACRESETMILGYYSCCYSTGIKTEITCDEKCALYHFSSMDGLFINAETFLGIDTIPNKRETQQYVNSDVCVMGDKEIVGYSTVRGGWNNGGPYTVYFCLKSDVPFSSSQVSQGKYAWVRFQKRDVNVKVGISFVSVDQARRNITCRTFGEQRAYLDKTWNKLLDKIKISGTECQKRMFYTALYHTMLMPVDRAGENPYFTDTPYYDDYYAIWDTYRTSTPLLTLLYPERERDIVNSLLNIYKYDGYMPDARSGNWNGRTQGGSNAEIVIADAFAKKLKGIDYRLALQAMIKDAEVPPLDAEKEGRGGLEEYNSLGYIPYGINRAGNRTVEYSYDDWCIAQVAKGLGETDIYQKYQKRSGNWKNLWRGDYRWQGMRGFILPKDHQGNWLDRVPWGKSKVFRPTIPYRPDTKVAPWYLPWWDTFFYEALSAEYSLSIPHDVPGLVKACGGEKAFVKRLDTFFRNGHYNVANEPSFMTPYLYHWVGRPEKSCERIRRIVNDYFNDTPEGLPGNDDSGAMSSWLIWNMLGLYPVAGQDLYIVGSPLVCSYSIMLPNGKRLQVSAKGGKWNHRFLHHEQLMNGGKLVLPWHEKMAERQIVTQKGAQIQKSNVYGKITRFTCHYILNGQYRNWEGNLSSSDSDTIRMKMNASTYLIPSEQVKQGRYFCWDSPQKGVNIYHCQGTFLFVSDVAMRDLNGKGFFVYDEITWRKVAEDEKEIVVKADVDNTMMRIAKGKELPWIIEMKNNPLGIDWKLELIH